jgi:hypothetical protein
VKVLALRAPSWIIYQFLKQYAMEKPVEPPVERLQKLLLDETTTPIDFFKLAREYVMKLAVEYGGSFVLALVGPDSRMILPVIAHSDESLDEFRAQEIGIMVDVVTVFASQNFVLGSEKWNLDQRDHKNQKPTATGGAQPWMFDELLDKIAGGGSVTAAEGLFRVARGREVREHSKGALSEFEFSLQSLDGTDSKEVLCRVLEPNLGGDVAITAGIRLSDSWYIRVFRYAPHTPGSEVYLLVLAEEQQEKRKQFLELSQESALGAYRIIEELRSQMSSVNPRYISRYFQIELGTARLRDVLDRAALGANTVYGEFLRSLFDGRGHDVSMRRILRFARGQELLKRLEPYLPKEAEKAADAKMREEQKKVRDYFKLLSKTEDVTKPPKSVSPKGKSRVAVAVSPRGGVGKTTVSYALAGYLAQQGKKTCFVELDLASPTVYTLDENFSRFLRKYNPGGVWADPVAHLMEIWSEASGAKDRRKKLAAALGTHIFRPEKSGLLHILGASPHAPRPGDMLAETRVQGGDVRFLKDLIEALESENFEWIFVDTAAGLRDFSMASLLMGKADVAMVFAHATKLSILTGLVHLTRWYQDIKNPPRRILVLNEMREIDLSLFRDLEAVDDFAAHWGNSKNGDLLPIKEGGLLTNHPGLCDGLSKIAWHEPWIRPERGSDLARDLTDVDGMTDLLDFIGAPDKEKRDGH